MIKETMRAEASALIAEMRKRSVTGTGITLSSGSNGLLVAAFDAMQAQLEVDKWISVDDRLPEYDTNDNWEYLVYDTLNNKVNHDYWICPSDGGQPFWNHYGSHVTHWQPLPGSPNAIKTLWAVNIPEEPGAPELLFAATSKEHAQSIVSRLHNEIFETYPTFGEAIADSIYVTEWQDSAEEHAESLATKWWEHTTFLENE